MPPRRRYRPPAGGLAHRDALSTMTRLIGTRIGGRPLRPANSAADLTHRAHHATAGCGQGAQVVTVSPSQAAGWVDTDVVLNRGDRIVVLAAGFLWGARRLGMGIGPDAALWIRVGQGAVVSMLGTGMIIDAEMGGRVRVLAAEPGVLDDTGDIDATVRRPRLRGSFAVALIRWEADLVAGLAWAAAADPELFGALASRASRPDTTPAGWHYHPRLGAAEIFHTPRESPGEIDCLTHGDVGILCRPVDVAITEDLHLSWSWKVASLPSSLAEHIEPTHDYLSVALAFDDGRDLTWMWSSELAVGTVFRCPLTYWRDRETHLVIRSGSAGLGAWTQERRTIAADIRAALAPPYPQRVTAIWLIANSTFQRGIGACRYRTLDLCRRHHWFRQGAALMKNFAGRTAAITGAGGGIGRALAVGLAAAGANLALSDINPAGLADTAALLDGADITVTTTVLDVADRDQVTVWAADTARHFGAVHLVFNNAGVAQGGSVHTNTYADYEWVLGINLWGVIHGTKAFLPYLVQAGDGHIVNVSSVFGLAAHPPPAPTTPANSLSGASPRRCARNSTCSATESAPPVCTREGSALTSCARGASGKDSTTCSAPAAPGSWTYSTRFC